VQEHPHLRLRASHAVEELRTLVVRELGAGAHHEEDLPLDEELGGEAPHLAPLVEDGERDVLLHLHAARDQLQKERAQVDGVREAVPQLAVHAEEGGEHAAGDVLVDQARTARTRRTAPATDRRGRIGAVIGQGDAAFDVEREDWNGHGDAPGG
jgi:hypothetical protein